MQDLDTLRRLHPDWSLARLFPLFTASSMLSDLPPAVLRLLHADVGDRPLRTWAECREAIARAQRAYARTEEALTARLCQVPTTFEALPQLAALVAEALGAGVTLPTDAHNEAFQQWMDSHYFMALNSNYLQAPRAVHHVLPHLAQRFSRADRVALVVVDGLSLWQWMTLRPRFEATEGTILSWLPTITQLARQALFRGAAPRDDYQQNPENECRLWRDFWQGRGFPSCEVQYLHSRTEFAINEGVRRLAYVDVGMDEMMHASPCAAQLHAATLGYGPRLAQKVGVLLDAGFRVFLTADHGNVEASGWGALPPAERTLLYRDGSRGLRHLIYTRAADRDDFLRRHPSLNALTRDAYLCLRGDECFQREGTTEVTHGGCHWMEVVIPYVEITKVISPCP